MNPRSGQYGLGGSLTAWASLSTLSPRQSRALSTCYLGLNPFVYSRYGRRQWWGPLPWTRVIVKDPFAMLSLPAIAALTGAVPVLVYRHPAAVLSSYRRMGWTADLEELDSALPPGARPSDLERLRDGSGAGDMARFWVALNERALADLELVDRAVVVAHEELAAGGSTAMGRLFSVLGLRRHDGVEMAPRSGAAEGAAAKNATALHNFDRSSESVASSWRGEVCPADLAVVDEIAAPTLRALRARSLSSS